MSVTHHQPCICYKWKDLGGQKLEHSSWSCSILLSPSPNRKPNVFCTIIHSQFEFVCSQINWICGDMLAIQKDLKGFFHVNQLQNSEWLFAFQKRGRQLENQSKCSSRPSLADKVLLSICQSQAQFELQNNYFEDIISPRGLKDTRAGQSGFLQSYLFVRFEQCVKKRSHRWMKWNPYESVQIFYVSLFKLAIMYFPWTLRSSSHYTKYVVLVFGLLLTCSGDSQNWIFLNTTHTQGTILTWS